MLVSEFCKQDVHSLASLIKAGEVSADETLSCALERMYAVNPKLNAIVADCSDWARQQLKKMRGDELFYGVPIVVKDLGFAMQGVPYTAGSAFFGAMQSTGNSDFIDRLLALGMLPFAKSNTPELGLSYVTEPVLFGACHNPYDLTCTPGGSSGGSAAAVAAGIAPIATASDGGGSIRIPAACCGLFGFKPTSGLMPTGPMVAEAWSGLATSHVLTRCVKDSAVLFELLSARFSTQAPTGFDDERNRRVLKIACVEGAFPNVPVAKPYLEAVDHVMNLLSDSGHELKHCTLSLDLDAIGTYALQIIAANTCAEIERQALIVGRKAQKQDLESVTWEFMQQGKTLSAVSLIEARNKLYQLVRPVHNLLNEVDFILTPALAQLPLAIGTLSMADDLAPYLQKNVAFSPFTSLFNQAGIPAMTMPVSYYKHLPISVQFASAKGRDRFLLNFAQQFSKQLPDFTQPVMAF